MPPSISVRAFAKINLGLKVLRLRADGYHEIRTVYQTIDLHDRLEIVLTRGSRISVECADPSVPSGRKNLVYGACQVWRRTSKFKGGIRVILKKQIPAGSGLGGGSSDAAACLLGLERLTGDCLDARARIQLASDLGSDAPLFLLGGRVLGCGRGEEIYPLTDLSRRHCLVVYPGFKISTADAYRQLDEVACGSGARAPDSPPSPVASQASAAPTGSKLTKRLGARKVKVFGVWSQFPVEHWGPAENDFEKVVFAKWPELEQLKIQFIRAGAETASLTGSGSAIYAIIDSARQLSRALRIVPPGWLAFRAQTLSREQYRRQLFSP
ncbi:MAG TPA: 4-(cytidine 5'-diphospho)-2-C-methyl-D-erythritol kinase [Terriglobia bacterium]|nr:4-(cytidine 5'-diphospho)-2-C-methyl-D-erythritol kinase [Terriglobia bacterium]